VLQLVGEVNVEIMLKRVIASIGNIYGPNLGLEALIME